MRQEFLKLLLTYIETLLGRLSSMQPEHLRTLVQVEAARVSTVVQASGFRSGAAGWTVPCEDCCVGRQEALQGLWCLGAPEADLVFLQAISRLC